MVAWAVGHSVGHSVVKSFQQDTSQLQGLAGTAADVVQMVHQICCMTDRKSFLHGECPKQEDTGKSEFSSEH